MRRDLPSPHQYGEENRPPDEADVVILDSGTSVPITDKPLDIRSGKTIDVTGVGGVAKKCPVGSFGGFEFVVEIPGLGKDLISPQELIRITKARCASIYPCSNDAFEMYLEFGLTEKIKIGESKPGSVIIVANRSLKVAGQQHVNDTLEVHLPGWRNRRTGACTDSPLFPCEGSQEFFYVGSPVNVWKKYNNHPNTAPVQCDKTIYWALPVLRVL